MNYIEKMISNLSTQHGTENLELRAIFNTLQDQLNTVMNSKLTWEDADNLLMSEDDVLTDQNAVELDSELWVDIRDIQSEILWGAFKRGGYQLRQHNQDKTMYRFTNGSLYKYCEQQNAYIHVYSNARDNTESKAIKAYESIL